jgi:hypothetical protein
MKPVFPYLASLKILDSTGQTQGGVFREPDERKELPDEVKILAQVQPDSMATLAMWAAGRELEQTVFLYAFRRDLVRRGLLGADGYPTTPRIGDRLVSVKNSRGVTVVVAANPPGAFVDAVVPASFGPGGANALYEVRLNPRRSSRRR